MTAPLCAMWLGHCDRPARLIVETLAPTGNHYQRLSWPCCDRLVCMKQANDHAEAFGLVHVETRLLTVADVLSFTSQPVVPA